MQESVIFSSGLVDYHYHSSFAALKDIAAGRDVVIITDENLARLYPGYFSPYETLVIAAGEASKSLDVVGQLLSQLIANEATRKTLIVGAGGGVVTDIAGFVAATYMRGVAFGFVPTSLLAMVDAAVGGKNGVDVGQHKNMVGTITQPEFLLYDGELLQTLPAQEWSNGFAEIIKYASIFDVPLFEELSRRNVAFYRADKNALDALIKRCVHWKNKTVVEDEREQGSRKLLNFGHTAGHAIETVHQLPHGYAISIGMLIACRLSEHILGLDPEVRYRLENMLQQYGLPIKQHIDMIAVMDILKIDKKRRGVEIDYILLEQLGNAGIYPLPFEIIEKALEGYESDN
jgi:3-dehydroquinate synthase